MKKLFGIIVCLSLIMSSLTVFANDTQSVKTRQVLIDVKTKISVPNELSEFESSNYNEDDKETYSFEWHDEKYTQSINIRCDEKGRIKMYSYYSDDMYSQNPESKKLTSLSKEDIFSYADAFLKKAAPESFENKNDCLIYVPKSINGSMSDTGTSYDFRYERIHDGVSVKDNGGSVSVFVGSDGKISVTRISVNFNYEATFEKQKGEVAGIQEKYKESFPVEMIYEKPIMLYYNMKNEESEKPLLIYRFKDYNVGYISAYSGKETKEDGIDTDVYNENSKSMADTGATGAVREEKISLTEPELKELENINNLKSASEIEKTLKKESLFGLTDELKLSGTRLYKLNDNYVIYINYTTKSDKYYADMDVTADALTGKIKAFYSFKGGERNDKEPSEKEKAKIRSTIEKFIKNIADDEFSNCELENESYTNGYAQLDYIRVVNGVKYPENGIFLSYDSINKVLNRYTLSFNNEEFSDPKNAIDSESAYEKILEEAPLEKIYIYSDKEYKLCYHPKYNGVIKVDALTGEMVNERTASDEKVQYDDIRGHWCEEAVNKLSEVGVQLKGASFNPETEITQEDLLRFFAAAVYYNHYIDVDTDELYENMYNNAILTPEQRNEKSSVDREDVFVYLIRMSGLDKVARLSSIYKTDFTDGSEISSEKIGYAAILHGIGIVEGDGGYLRPKQKITRAEAAVLLYKYLTNY